MLEEIKDIRGAANELVGLFSHSDDIKKEVCGLRDRIESRCDMLEGQFRELKELHVVFDKSESVPTCASNGEHKDSHELLISLGTELYAPECCKGSNGKPFIYVNRERDKFRAVLDSGEIVTIQHCPVHGEKLVYKERQGYCCIDMRATCEKCDYTPENFCPWCGTKVPDTVK